MRQLTSVRNPTTGHVTTDAMDADSEPPPNRRRFLRRAGFAAGAAWVAPTILSATPAAAGALSPAGCPPTLTAEAISPGCPSPRILSFTVALPQGCQGFFAVDVSENGGAFIEVVACSGPTSAYTDQVSLDVVSTYQARIRVLDGCGPGAQTVASVLTKTYPGCN